MEKLKKLFIETDVDKLLEIVEKKGKITIDECSVILNIPENVIEEWAEILAEDNFIEIDYGLKYTFLKAKKLTKKEGKDMMKKLTKEKGKMGKEEKNIFKKMKTVEWELKKGEKTIHNLERGVDKKLKHIQKESEETKEKDKFSKEMSSIRESEKEIDVNMEKLKEKFYEIKESLKKLGGPPINIEAQETEIKYIEEKIEKLKKSGDALEKVVDLLDKKVEGEKPSEINKLRNYFSSLKKNTKELYERKEEAKKKAILLKKDMNKR